MVLYNRIKNRRKAEKVVEEVQEQVFFVKPDLAKLKAAYIAKLNEIEEKYNQDKTKIRPAYESMSKVVREFVYKATGTEVDKFTLAEISNTEYAGLTKLVGEYYQPEFDKISEGDVRASLEKSRRLVAEWN
jgi:GTPase Era involved in 16S rRNA processing